MQVGDLIIHKADWYRCGFRYCGTIFAIRQIHDEPTALDPITVLWHGADAGDSPMIHQREELEVYSEAKNKLINT